MERAGIDDYRRYTMTVARDNRGARASSAQPIASVIVPARNAGRDLPDLIAALEAQHLARESFEVIVADDGSTDGGCDGLETDDGWLRVSRGSPINSYAARNRAASEARGAVLAFCDADCRPAPAWLHAGLAALEDADLVAGRIRHLVPAHPSVWTLIELESFKDHEKAVRDGVAETANLFIRKETFDRLGGFDASLPSGGDHDFVKRCRTAGAALRYAPDAMVWHTTRDGAVPFLKARWRVQRARAMRQASQGTSALRAFATPFYIPFFGLMRTRLRSGTSWRLDRARLAESGVRVSAWGEIKALSIIYALPYVALGAKAAGRRAARRQRGKTSRVETGADPRLTQ